MHAFASIVSQKKHFFIVCLTIVLFALAARLWRVGAIKDFYFDEVYHGFTATTFLHNDSKGYEYWQTPPEGVAYEWTHPPLAKLFMAGGMVIFGENSFGWRISSVLFGTGVIALTGVLAHTLFKRKSITLLTLTLVSLDGLLLTMSRVAMNDMHFLFFMLASIIFYIHFRRIMFEKNALKTQALYLTLTIICFGLSLANKWTALYGGLALGLDALSGMLVMWKVPLKAIITGLLLGLIIIPLVYLGSYGQFFLQGHTLTQWKETTQQMWWYHTGLKATHPYQSRPWQWISDLRPVWLFVDYAQNDQGKLANIYNVANPLLLWLGFASIVLLTLQALYQNMQVFVNFLLEKKIRQRAYVSWEVGFLLLVYFIMWVPWIFSPRIMFFYHYAPAIPILCILTSYGIHRFRRLSLLLVLLILVTFCLLYPLNTGIFMPQIYFDTIFKIFPSWR